jgi:CDP-glycerol glycerophosphotransferase
MKKRLRYGVISLYGTILSACAKLVTGGRIQPNKLFVMTFDNRYSCNPRYIVEELLARQADLDIVWAVSPRSRGTEGTFPPEVRQVPKLSWAMYREMVTAGIWLDNALNCLWYGMPKKRKGQVLINTWHGSLGIKRLGGDDFWLQRASRCNGATDFCLSNSTFEEDVFRESFWPDVPYLRYGHARNDLLLRPQRHPAMRAKVEQSLDVKPGQRMLLYAPTFRDNGRSDCFDLDLLGLKTALEERFGGEWVILVRMHLKNRRGQQPVEMQDWCKNANGYPDMQELLAAVDAGVTDYSSWAYDYLLTGRPLFLYAKDAEEYRAGRGLYYPLETTPFPLAQDNQTLLAQVRAFDEETYRQRVAAFLQEKGCMEDGHASERAAERIATLSRAQR